MPLLIKTVADFTARVWLMLLLTVPAQAAEFQPLSATTEHLQQLQAGGFVLYLRHGATDARIPDQIPVDLNDCNSQRPLTDAGRAVLDRIGGYVRQLAIPYTDVISSPFCRAVESAQRVFGQPVQVDTQLRYTAAMPAAERQPAVERTRYWISLPVPAGSNRIVVAHGPNIAELLDYLPPEATLIIFRPLGDDFAYVASIPPLHWPVLLQSAQDSHP